MSWPAYYSLDESPLVWVSLPNVNRTPGAPVFGAGKTLEENNTVFETNFGVRHIYRQFNRTIWELTFRIFESQIQDWRDLHDLMDGQLTAFYFRLGDDYLYCRKEAGFDPKQLTIPTTDPLYEYTITLTEEFLASDF